MTKREFEPEIVSKPPGSDKYETIKKIMEAVTKCHNKGYMAPHKIELPEGVRLKRIHGRITFHWYEGIHYERIIIYNCDYNVKAIFENLKNVVKYYEPKENCIDISFNIVKALETSTNREITLDQYRDQLAFNVDLLLNYLKIEKAELDRVNKTENISKITEHNLSQ
jgi:mannose/fructose/N-acetylgalactosamine-specific phosphotransferase system component IIB